MLEPKQNPGFSIPFEANPKSALDENTESERLAELQNGWLKDLLSRFLSLSIYRYLENSPKKACALIGQKPCLYKSMETQN